MPQTVIEMSLAWFLIPLLLAVILFDLRLMRIPNPLVLLFCIVFAAGVLPSLPVDELLWRLGIAALILVVGIIGFAANLLGGGDVKVLAALALFIPTHLWAQFALLFSFCLFVGILGLLAFRPLFKDKNTKWLSLKDRRRFPMGLSIGAAGILLVALFPAG